MTLTGDGRCLFRQRYLAGPKLLAQVNEWPDATHSVIMFVYLSCSPYHCRHNIQIEQEKDGDARIGPRGVWTQAGGAGGSQGPLLANAGRIPANPVNTNMLVLEQGAKAGKVRVR